MLKLNKGIEAGFVAGSAVTAGLCAAGFAVFNYFQEPNVDITHHDNMHVLSDKPCSLTEFNEGNLSFTIDPLPALDNDVMFHINSTNIETKTIGFPATFSGSCVMSVKQEFANSVVLEITKFSGQVERIDLSSIATSIPNDLLDTALNLAINEQRKGAEIVYFIDQQTIQSTPTQP